jgi:DNA-binding response OmpR family regulator
MHEVDLILLDVMMPGLDGFETCRVLKEHKALADVPVIFLTARTEINDIVTGFNLGGVDYISKPFSKEELVARVRNHVQLKMMRDYLKMEMENARESRNEFMRMMLDFGKSLSH